jgi:riboflavin kinase/FMN adenylyltransferase
MPHVTSLAGLSLQNSWLTIGVFDGVHRGHQEILRSLTAGAHAQGAPAVVFTFSPHPASVLAGIDIPCLTTPQERADLLLALGVDWVVTHPFDQELAAQSAEDFMESMRRHFGLCRLLVGHDFALGRGRAGTAERLAEIGRCLGFEVIRVEAVRQGAGIISSSAIRRQLAEGDVAGAVHQLSRFHSLAGTVVPGDGRGRTIGVPTANVDVPAGKVLPANGVYACLAWVDGKPWQAVTNIGVRPTFTSGQASARVEAHLMGYSGDLYGRQVRLEFAARLRGEQKFASVEALVAQIKADIAKAREILPGPG